MATSAQVIDAVQAALRRGWRAYPSRGGYVVNAPSSEVEHPTEDMHRWAYPFDTYTRLRQIKLAVNGDRVIGAWSVESVPWVPGNDTRLSFKKAIEFLESE